MRRVLVTGARGFVGRQVLTALERRGEDVVAVSTGKGSSPPTVASSARWLSADLLAVGGPEVVVEKAAATHLVHLAWYAEHGRFWTAVENLDWVGATLRLVRAFREAGGTRAVVAGTCAEYEWGHAGACVEGETPLRPTTLYGACKHATHTAASAYADQESLSLAWARIFFCFGPGEAEGRLVPSVARSLLNGREAAVSSGEQLCDFLAVEEVGDAFAALVLSDVDGAVNVASGRPVAVREVVAAVGRAAGGGANCIRFGARPSQRIDAPEIVAAVHRLRDEVGWAPQESLQAGVDRAVDWWRRQA